MQIIKEKSIVANTRLSRNSLFVTTKNFKGFKTGINKEEEYSWFYIVCLKGEEGESITLNINNPNKKNEPLSLKNGLAHYSLDGWQWHKINSVPLTSYGF